MEMSSVKIPSITADRFEKDVIQASHDRLVVVDFSAEWCGPCKALGPILEQIADARAGVISIVKVDVDAESRLSMLHGVRSLPTVTMFRDGRKVDELVGLQSLEALLARFDAAATA